MADRRRSKFATAAEEWIRRHAKGRSLTTAELWEGLCKAAPELTTPSERRKTPKATFLRDIRYDPAFEMIGGEVRLRDQ